eukprot:gb/GECG01015259.1/.p1 GENE.gb/GECG01015259.1/~~gb/GECG01015259.1/.p1  ORF type:complete len:508 (+),score=75.75 gb/GECG01015259.1/:1-1524(+)
MMSGGSTDTSTSDAQFKELADFLTHSKPEVRRVAVANLLGMTVDESVKQQLVQVEIPRRLSRLLGDFNSIAKDALKCLINLSDHTGSLEQLFKGNIVDNIMSTLMEPSCENKRLCVILLSNLSHTPEGCVQILQLNDQNRKLKGLHLRRLIQWFSLDPKGSGEDDEFEYVATVLQNCSQMEDAREIVLEPSRNLLSILLQQLSERSVIRRRGIAGTVRNCCFEIHKKEDYLLSRSLRLIETIVTPLAGPEPQDIDDVEKMPREWVELGSSKRHEADAETRRLLVEALVLIAGNRKGREVMRKLCVYKIIKSLHEWIEGVHPSEESADDEQASSAVARRSARALAEEEERGTGANNNEEHISQDRVGEKQPRQLEPDERGNNTEEGLNPDDEKTAYAINVLVNYIQRDESENDQPNFHQVSTAIPRDGESENSEVTYTRSATETTGGHQEEAKAKRHLIGTRTFELLQEDEEESKEKAWREQQKRSTVEAARPNPQKLVSAAGFDDVD